jgi:tripartite-type tricarboxylate transporter receptor subunit TctC
MHRRHLLVMPALAAPLLARRAEAQARPVVRVVVGSPPGGGVDTSARIYGESVGPALGETWVVETRTGANGSIGSALVARSDPDGRTLMCNSDSHLLTRGVMKSVAFDPIGDFTPISRLIVSPLVLVGAPSLAARDMAALLAEVRARPDRHSFANTSLGTSGHLATEVFRLEAGVPLLIVTYRGTGPALQDVVGGQTSLMMAPLVSALPLIQGGRLRAYCVTGGKRAAVAPDIPSAEEVGIPALSPIAPWFALWGPKGLPVASVARTYEAVQAASRTRRSGGRSPSSAASRWSGRRLRPSRRWQWRR